MKCYPVILSIAGSDCSGGAGIQADIKTISALGGYAASVITAITVQNTQGVKSVQTLPPDLVKAQIEAILDDLHVDCIKIGMIGNESIARAIAHTLQEYPSCPIVYDPVMVSTSGHCLLPPEAIESIKCSLFPLTTLLTPNLNEAGVLNGKVIGTIEEMKKTAYELSQAFHTAVLIKGGHLEGEDMCDVLHTQENKMHIYKTKKIKSNNLHGTGCTLSSAIATYIGKGYAIDKAIAAGKEYVSSAIHAGKGFHIGNGHGPLCHNFATIR